MIIHTVNPATEAVLNKYITLEEKEVSALIEAGHLAYRVWKKTPFVQRKQLMLKLAGLLTQKKADLAVLMANEMGKPIKLGQAEIEKCVWLCEHYAEHAEEYLQPRTINTEMKKTMVCYQPLGRCICDNALELPFLASLPLCCSDVNGWKCCNCEACPNFNGYGE